MGGIDRRIDRRRFLRRAGATGALGGAVALRGKDLIRAEGRHHKDIVRAQGRDLHAAHRPGHGSSGAVGTVDHNRNGFHPRQILTDFDAGVTSKDSTGTTVHEYSFVAVDKEIEVAPGVFFPAWTYNGRVPGPTIRVTEGDRVRIHFENASDHLHTIHFHGIHRAEVDGVPGQGEIGPGETFIYDFIAEPFGTHLYHCHSAPLVQHIHRGLYGAFIVDPKRPRPEAHEMVIVMNGFDTNFDGENEVYAANSIAFAYVNDPIVINSGELQRLHLVNLTEFDPVNSIHLHANFFHLYRTGTSLRPSEFTDTISMGQAERHMLEFSYRFPGRFMFHAHQTEFADLGWMSFFEVVG